MIADLRARSSWLMLARKRDLASLAAFDRCSAATRTATSRSSSAVRLELVFEASPPHAHPPQDPRERAKHRERHPELPTYENHPNSA